MFRLACTLIIGALLVAPLGFGGVNSVVISMIARGLFVVLLIGLVGLTAAGATWSRRWPV